MVASNPGGGHCLTGCGNAGEEAEVGGFPVHRESGHSAGEGYGPVVVPSDMVNVDCDVVGGEAEVRIVVADKEDADIAAVAK